MGKMEPNEIRTMRYKIHDFLKDKEWPKNQREQFYANVAHFFNIPLKKAHVSMLKEKQLKYLVVLAGRSSELPSEEARGILCSEKAHRWTELTKQDKCDNENAPDTDECKGSE
jgi:hypothetical protein